MASRYASSDLGLEPLTARSVALSALLGEHPPRLSGRALVALGEVLGIAGATMRTALSRMSGAGEIAARDGTYVLGDRMAHRQRAQDAGRRPPPEPWDSTWWFVVVDAARRPLGERRAFRSRMRQDRMGELRPDVWLRPANIPGPAGEAGTLVVRGALQEGDPAALVAELWDLDRLAERGRTLRAQVEDALGWMGDADPDALLDASLLTVAVLRFLLTEPRLPAVLVGPRWPPDGLRDSFVRFEEAYRALRSSVLAEAGKLDRTPADVTEFDRADHSP